MAGLWEKLFSAPNNHDDAFDARIAVVEGLIAGNTSDQVTALRQRLATLKAKTDLDRADLMELQNIEADVPIYADSKSLYAIYLRMKDRCWRLNKTVKDDWIKELKRLFPDAETIVDEALARKQLTLVAREINADTAEFVRKTAEKSRVLFRLSALCAIVILLYFVIGVGFVLRANVNGFLDMVVPVALAGGIGASISALRGVVNEKLRDQNLKLLTVRYGIRSFLGLFYAAFVYACVITGILPLIIPEERLAFLLALGFASGFTDALFAQTVSRFTQPSEETPNS